METRVTFQSKKGYDLSGVLHEPETGALGVYAILAHCFTCTKSLNTGKNIADTLSKSGISTLRFDFTGLGASKGQFADSSFSTDVADLVSASTYLAENYAPPQLMVGHSLGGTAVLAAGSQIDSLRAIATVGSPSSPEHILHMLENQLDEIESKGEATVKLAGRNFVFKQCFVDDARNYPLDIENLHKPLMVLHAPFDATVSVNEASKIFAQAKHPKNFVSLDKSDHLLMREEDARYVGSIIGSWALRYVERPEVKESAEEVPGVVVSGETANGFFNVAKARSHQFIIDEPLSYGGTDIGPTPYEYLGTALGSCTSMTLNGYARRKGLDVSEVSVHVTHSRIHAQDCEACEKQDGKVDQFSREITITGNITEEQRQRMLQIADLCPVHKTLESEIHIKTSLTP